MISYCIISIILSPGALDNATRQKGLQWSERDAPEGPDSNTLGEQMQCLMYSCSHGLFRKCLKVALAVAIPPVAFPGLVARVWV